MPGTDDIGAELDDTMKSLGKRLADSFASNFDSEDIVAKIVEVEKGALNVAKAFGQGREQIVAIKASLADAVTSVTLLGGGFEDIAKTQLAIANAISRSVILNSDYYDDLYAMTQVTGQEAGDVTGKFKSAGFSLYSTAGEMQKVVNLTRSIGVNTSQVSAAVVNNIDKLNAYGFDKGIQGLAKMAAQATLLKVDMGRAFTLADQMLTPEKAIETAAAMQRLGVTQSELLDPLRLMDLSMNDVEGLQNQIVNMAKSFAEFNEETGRFEIPKGARLQLKEISTSLGYSYDEIVKMGLGAKELDMKMSKIQFPDFATEEQKEFIANMAELKPGTNEYTVRFKDDKGEIVEKSISDLIEKDFPKLIDASQPVDMIKLAGDQLTVSKQMLAHLDAIASRTGYAFAGMESTEIAQQAMLETTKALGTTFSGEKLSIEKLRESLDGGIKDLFSSLKDGEVIEGFGTAISKTTDYVDKAFYESLGKAEEALNKLGNSSNPLIKFFSTIGSTEKGKEKGVEPPKDNVIKGNDFILKTHPEDKLVMVGGTNLYGERGGTTPTPTESKISGDVNLKITIDAPGDVDQTKLKQAFEDYSVMQKIVEMFIKTVNNNGVSGQISPTDMRNRIMNMSGMGNR
jgi:hypothetical protein